MRTIKAGRATAGSTCPQWNLRLFCITRYFVMRSTLCSVVDRRRQHEDLLGIPFAVEDDNDCLTQREQLPASAHASK